MDPDAHPRRYLAVDPLAPHGFAGGGDRRYSARARVITPGVTRPGALPPAPGLVPEPITPDGILTLIADLALRAVRSQRDR
jgi:hypothetical protein